MIERRPISVRPGGRTQPNLLPTPSCSRLLPTSSDRWARKGQTPLSCPGCARVERNTCRVQSVRVNTLRVGSARVRPQLGERILSSLRFQFTC
eukprot:8742830-Pyramimonas_sp.AAC.1